MDIGHMLLQLKVHVVSVGSEDLRVPSAFDGPDAAVRADRQGDSGP